MRILQVLTWVDQANSFGGPTRVAVNQADELRQRGHIVDVIAAQPSARLRGTWTSDAMNIRGFDARQLVPGTGFSGVFSFGLLRFAWSRVRSYDVVHVHLARDLVSLPVAAIARARGVPFVLQTHGMVDPSDKFLARILDYLLTRRIARTAERIFVLTEQERSDVIAAVGPSGLELELLRNGVPIVGTPAAPETVVPDVLFCSRLHQRKRPIAFVQMAAELDARGVKARFAIVGADEGELDAVRRSIDEYVPRDGGERGAIVSYEGALEPSDVAARLARSDLLVLPSVNEPFPMVVLETLAAGRPVIITESCGLADFVTEHDCGLVVPGDDLDALVDAAASLIGSTQRRTSMGARARAAVEQHLGMGAVADQLEACYERIGTGRQ